MTTTHEVAAGAGGFFPPGFTPPTGGGHYFKPQIGDNKVRIVSKPIMGFEGWDKTGGKNVPIRARYDDSDEIAKITAIIAKNEAPKERKLKFFLAMVVYDYAAEELKVWEITQSTIIEALNALSNDDEWGDPSCQKNGYGLKVTKSGSGLDTKYTVMPGQKIAVKPEMVAGLDGIDLDKLFSGDSPFLDTESGGVDNSANEDDGDDEIPF